MKLGSHLPFWLLLLGFVQCSERTIWWWVVCSASQNYSFIIFYSFLDICLEADSFVYLLFSHKKEKVSFTECNMSAFIPTFRSCTKSELKSPSSDPTSSSKASSKGSSRSPWASCPGNLKLYVSRFKTVHLFSFASSIKSWITVTASSLLLFS